MAADRWFFGIPAQNGITNSMTFVPASGKDTYILDYYFYASDATNGGDFRVRGLSDNAILDPDFTAPHQIIDAKVFTELKAPKGFQIKLTANTGLCYTQVDPGGTSGTFIARLLTVELPTVPRPRSVDEILRRAQHTEILERTAWITFGAAAGFTAMEKTVNGKLIQQPVFGGAVADELNVVSTLAGDTLAGVGMQKLKFDYWDASGTLHEDNEVEMAGQTPVNLIAAGYTDVYIIKRAYGSQFGANLTNLGHILFQDDAV